jgi:hypothetical protein
MSETAKQETDFFDTAGLARFLNVSQKSIVKWRDAQRLPGAVRCGRVWRFRRVEVEKRLLSGRLLLDAQ